MPMNTLRLLTVSVLLVCSGAYAHSDSLFNGYSMAFNGGWFLAAIPAASVEYRRFGVNLTIVPSYKDRLYGAVSIQFKLKIFD